jgi:2-polyprenyl-3-methyl-5-hydroxy-6-metoxy-1,4-benzoquinol methylase
LPGETQGYRDRLFHAYVSTRVGTYRPADAAALERDRRLFAPLVRRFLPPNRDAEILEVGCGSGSFLDFLRREGYRRMHGIDVAPEQVRPARTLGIEDAELADAAAYLGARPDAYDLIVALDVIEHFPKDDVPYVHGVASALRWFFRKVLQQLIRLYLLIEPGTPGSGVFSANLCAVARNDTLIGQRMPLA